MKWYDKGSLIDSRLPVIKVRGVNEYVLGLPQGRDFILENTPFSSNAKRFLLEPSQELLKSTVISLIDLILPENTEIKDIFLEKCSSPKLSKGYIMDHIMIYVSTEGKGFLDSVTSSPSVCISNLSLRNVTVDAKYDPLIKNFLDTRTFLTSFMLPYSFAMVEDNLSIARCHDEKKVFLNKQPMYYYDFYKLFRLVVEAYEKQALELCLYSLDDDYAFVDSCLDRQALSGIIEPSPRKEFVSKTAEINKDSWGKLYEYIRLMRFLAYINPVLSIISILLKFLRPKIAEKGNQIDKDNNEGDLNE